MASILIQIDAYDPVGAAPVTLRIASENDDSLCHLNSQTWWPALQTPPVFSYDYFDGSFAGSIETPSSSMVVSIDPWPNFARYSFGDARVQIWTGTLGAAWGTYTLRFDGQVTAQPEISQGLATISFKVDDRWLDAPLLTTLLGTGGIEGPAEMLGVPRPLMLGRPRYAPGLMIDSVNNVLMLSGYGLIEDVEVAMEALAQFGASVGDYASYSALIAATIPAGGWGTCKASGLVRHGAPPAGKLSYMVKGDKAGPDGWARLPGQLIRRIALLAGGTGRIADASLNALDAARPYNVSLVVTEQTTARDLIQQIAASVNAVAGISWTGNLWARPVSIGSSARTLASDGSSLPPVAKVDQVAVSAPFWRLAIEAEKTWAVHNASEVFYQDPAPGGTNSPEKNATSGGNVIFNGDAEQGDLRGWEQDPLSGYNEGTFAIDTTNKQSGQYSFKITKSATADTQGNNCIAIPCKPGETYVIRLWAYVNVGTASGVKLKVYERASYPVTGRSCNAQNATAIQTPLNSVATANGVNTWTVEYTVGASMQYFSVGILNDNGGPLISWWEVQMIKVINPLYDVATLGSIPPTIPNVAFTYTSTTTSITVSWAAMTIYRANGTTISISAGSQAITGLTANTNYQIYPYAVDNGTSSASMAFATGLTGSSGSPAVCYPTAGSAEAAAVMYQRGNIPLYTLSATTPASGSGGGGGGGRACIHPSTLIETDGGWIEAGDLSTAAKLNSPKGFVPLAQLGRKNASNWIEITTQNGQVTVTPDHRLHLLTGSEIRAHDLRLGHWLQAGGSPQRVIALKLIEDAALLVQVELEDPHLYYLGRASLLCHNPKF